MAETAETNPLIDHLGSAAATLAYWHRHHGDAGVRELLSLTASEPVPDKPWLLTLAQRVKITTRETLEGTASELESRRLRKLARIVREHAVGRPREIDLPEYEPNSVNYRAWLAKLKRNGKL